METDIASNLQANIEQVTPAPDKYDAEYHIGAMTFNISKRTTIQEMT